MTRPITTDDGKARLTTAGNARIGCCCEECGCCYLATETCTDGLSQAECEAGGGHQRWTGLPQRCLTCEEMYCKLPLPNCEGCGDGPAEIGVQHPDVSVADTTRSPPLIFPWLQMGDDRQACFELVTNALNGITAGIIAGLHVLEQDNQDPCLYQKAVVESHEIGGEPCIYGGEPDGIKTAIVVVSFSVTLGDPGSGFVGFGLIGSTGWGSVAGLGWGGSWSFEVGCDGGIYATTLHPTSSPELTPGGANVFV